jgi:competence protein ComGC
MNHVVKKQQGFTIIELVLAMTFISFLLLAIAMSIIQLGAIYNQGTTVKEINQASRDINDDLRRNISSTSSLDLTTDYVLSPATNPAGGRLCLGAYSYIWNYAKAIDSNAPGLTKNQGAAASVKPPAFIKVPDQSGLYCEKNPSTGQLVQGSIREEDIDNIQELLKPGDHELGIHNFSFVTPVPATALDANTDQQLYSLTYTIGTTKISALNATQSACLAAGVANADPLYCNVQPFSLVIRAGNGVN